MLGAISIVLGMTPLGFIPIGPTRATIMHIPVIIGAITAGPLVGGLVGLIFGLFSIFQAITNPTPVSFVFLNPLVSVLPRILIGLVTYYIYEGLKRLGDKNTKLLLYLIWISIFIYLAYGIYENIVKFQGITPILVNSFFLVLSLIFAYFTSTRIRDKSLDLVIATITGTLTNTVGVLLMIYLLYGERFVLSQGLNPLHARKIILGIAFTNGIPEAIIAIIVVVSVVNILQAKESE